MFIRKSEKKGIITLGILTMALFVLPQTIHKSECPIFLIPYSRLSDTTQPVTLKHLVIELNSADSTTLIGVRGIGPYYAKKILRYREQLGGFHSTRQLGKKELDTMSFKSVLHHPYLEYEDVQLIFNAKRKFGKINYSILESQKVLPPFKLKKIKPYFK